MKTGISKNSFSLVVIVFGLFVSSCTHNLEMSDSYGNFEAVDRLIASESAGRLIWFSVDEGSQLAGGDTVGLVDTVALALKKRALDAGMETIKTKAAGLLAGRKVLEQQLKNLKVEEARIKGLYEEKAATRQKLDEITGKVKVLELQIRQMDVQRHSVLQEQQVTAAEMASLNDRIAKCYVVNPVKGTVLEKYAESGEMVSPGKPLYKIADVSEMFLRVYVDETILPEIKTGGSAQVLIDNRSGQMDTLSGVISWISDEAEFTPKIIQTRRERVNLVYAVRIRVENDGRLKIGMPGEANFR